MRSVALFMGVLGVFLGASGVEALAQEIDAEKLTTESLAPPDDGSIGPPKPVLVVNPADQPLPVAIRDLVHVKEATPIPFNEKDQLQILDGDEVDELLLFTVPSGKQLVVTHATIVMSVEPHMSFFIVGATNGVVAAEISLVPVLSGPVRIGGGLTLQGSSPVHFILGAGSKLFCLVFRDTSVGGAGGTCSVSGYLVDVP